MFNAVEVASLFGTLELRDTATNTLRQFDSSLETTAQNLQRIGGQMQGLGLAISGAVAPLIAFGVQGVRVAATFDQSMATISARTGIVGEDLDRVRQFALQLGADTAFSAQQAADAFLELLASGQSLDEAMATLPAVLSAAAASGEDLGKTADDVTNILASFQLSADSAQRVVDALAKAAGASSADMSGLGEAFANVGGMASQFGLDVETTAAIFAIFAENGIKGAEAGTQLRSMLMNMSRDTDSTRAAWEAFGSSLYDSRGRMRPLAVVLEEITRAAANMTDEDKQKAFADLAGSYGVLGLTALTSSIDIGTMLGTMGQSADAASVASARMNTFEGAMDSLGGSIETLQITVFTPFMNDVLRPLVQQVTEVVNSFTEWASANPETARTVISVVLAVAGLGAGLLALGTIISVAGTALGGLAVLFSSGLIVPIGLAIAAVAGLVAAVGGDFETIKFYAEYYLGAIWDKIRPIWETLRDWFTENLMPALEDTFNNHVQPLFQSFQDFLSGLWDIVGPHLQKLYDWFVTTGLPGVLSFITDTVMPGVNDFIDLIKGIWDTVSPALLDFANWFLNDGLPQVVDTVEDAITSFEQLIYLWNYLTGNTKPINLHPVEQPPEGTPLPYPLPDLPGQSQGKAGFADLGTGTPFKNAGTAFDAGKGMTGKGGISIHTININGDQSGRTAQDYRTMFVQMLEEMAG